MSFDTGGATLSTPSVAPHATPDADLDTLDQRASEPNHGSGERETPLVEPGPTLAGSGASRSDVTAVRVGSETSADTVQLSNGLTCSIPSSSPLAKLLKSQRTWIGPTAKERLGILRRAKSIAIVGASPNPARSSYFVGTYLLQSSDYRVYFVNPNADEILGQKAYPDLASLPEVPDIVDVFRKASDIPQVIDDVLAVGAKTVWVQLGIWNQDAAVYGESRGLTVVMDRCIKVEHARFHGGLHLLGFDTGVISSRKLAR